MRRAMRTSVFTSETNWMGLFQERNSVTYSRPIFALLLLHRTLSAHFIRAGETTACSCASGGWDSATGGGEAS